MRLVDGKGVKSLAGKIGGFRKRCSHPRYQAQVCAAGPKCQIFPKSSPNHRSRSLTLVYLSRPYQPLAETADP